MSFWKGRRVFLTGHTGFKGSWLALWLQYLGANVRGYSLESPTNPSLFEAASVSAGMDSRIADIRDFDLLQVELVDFQPEIVLHLAAQPLVRYSYLHPLDTYSVNVMGTANLLQAARSCGAVRAIVIVTTDKCYENKEWIWPYRENDQLGGYDPYSSSKACAELVVSAFRNSFFNHKSYGSHGVAIATARAGNVIGGGDWAEDRLIPDIVRAFSMPTPVHIRNPHSTRPWQHVMEPLRGYLMLAEALHDAGDKYSGAWNFGPNDAKARPVIDIVKHMAKLWGGPATWQVEDETQVHEATYLKLDWTKAHEELRWKPLLTLEAALELTTEWYKAWINQSDMKSMTLRQIADFELKAGSGQDQRDISTGTRHS